MSTDDRTETITDPAEIRATDEPDERTPNEVHVDESGCSCKTGPYRGFQRDPIDAACPKHGGPLRHGDGDVTVCHPDGSTTIIREPDERGDFPCCTTPAPVGAGLDLDAVPRLARLVLVDALDRAESAEAEVRRLTRWQFEAMSVMAGLQGLGSALGMRLGESITGHAAAEAARALTARAEAAESVILDQRRMSAEHDAFCRPATDRLVARAESAEAEVGTLRAQVNGLHEELLRGDPDVGTLRARLAEVEAVERGLSEGWVMLATVSDRAEFVRTFRAALATTGEGECIPWTTCPNGCDGKHAEAGEGEHVAREVFTAEGIPFVSCSCTNAKSPTSSRWLTEHVPNGGVAELQAVVKRQADQA